MAKRNDTPKLYIATFPNGKQYIGITIATLLVRKSEHHSKARKGSKTAFHNAIRKFGDPKWEIAAVCSSYEGIAQLEIDFIKEFNTLAPNGYNLTVGGDMSWKGRKLSKEHRENLSKAHKGYKFPESQKKAMSLAKKNAVITLEHRKALSEAKKGKPMSESHYKNYLKTHSTCVKVYDKKTNEFIGEWSTVKSCAKDLNILCGSIHNCLSGLSKSTNKYKIIKGERKC